MKRKLKKIGAKFYALVFGLFWYFRDFFCV